MFKITASDGKTAARTGLLETSHGTIETPLFLPVATKGSAKYVSHKELEQIGYEAFICNSFLLYLRPGLEEIESHKGIHKFIGWKKAIFTDSGGFQVHDDTFIEKIKENGVVFKSPYDNSKHFLTPKDVIKIQNRIGADCILQLDDLPKAGLQKNRYEESVNRTIEWAKECIESHKNREQVLFGIVQGGTDKRLREKNLEAIKKLDFGGIAFGGFSVGEPLPLMNKLVKHLMPKVPKEKPVHLLGVGSIPELLENISYGVDIFDSCYPTRVARHGLAFTSNGEINLLKRKNASKKPIDENCKCFVCQQHSRAFVYHLLKCGEPNGLYYLSYHNLHLIAQLMKGCRLAIKENGFRQFMKEWLEKQCP